MRVLPACRSPDLHRFTRGHSLNTLVYILYPLFLRISPMPSCRNGDNSRIRHKLRPLRTPRTRRRSRKRSPTRASTTITTMMTTMATTSMRTSMRTSTRMRTKTLKTANLRLVVQVFVPSLRMSLSRRTRRAITARTKPLKRLASARPRSRRSLTRPNVLSKQSPLALSGPASHLIHLRPSTVLSDDRAGLRLAWPT